MKRKRTIVKNDKYALLSVFDKTGIVELAKALNKRGYKIISTGGTAKILTANKIPIIPIQEITGNPESFDGRMKTISFQIESGILFDRTKKKHTIEAKDLQIKPIDVVVCNLYPFEQTVSKPNVKLDDAIENIDVGGPTMIRAAAKNFKNVLVVVDPKDYERIITYCHSESAGPDWIGASRRMKNLKRSFANAQDDMRRRLAAKAFTHLSFYDSQIAKYFSKELFPDEITLAGRKVMDLRYGENPHQQSAVYVTPNAHSPFENLKQLWGRGLSLTNVTDINAGLESVNMFADPAAVVIKHNSPCGIALGKTISQALERALEADPESAFGGVVVINKKMDLKAAEVIKKFKEEGRGNMDIIAAPEMDEDALEFLKKIRKSTGIYTFQPANNQQPTARFAVAPGEPRLRREALSKRANSYNLKWLNGGFVLQTHDATNDEDFKQWKVVTKKKPTIQQMQQAKTGWKFVTRIKSNSILIIDKNLSMTRGIGTGQTSRVRSTKIALEQAGKYTKNGILISDSFFPFDDSVRMAGKKGISVIVQQGGSINDQASIDAANELGITMIFTGRRAFWH